MISNFERKLPDLMLFNVMLAAQANGPPVRGLQTHSAVGVAMDMRAFDRPIEAARYAAVMPAHPGAMRGTLAVDAVSRGLALKPVR